MSGIVVAPFSNSGIRDWPASHYRRLVALLLDRLDADEVIHVTGTANQKLRAHAIVRPFPAARVVNQCGKLAWAELVTRMRASSCVIGNNSGVAHLGGFFRVPTVCVFGGSHQRHEWRTLGETVVLVTRLTACSPCQLDHGQVSPYDKACLRQIAPEVVADAAFAIMARVARMRADGLAAAGSGAPMLVEEAA